MTQIIKITEKTMAIDLINVIAKRQGAATLDCEFQGLTFTVKSELMKINGKEIAPCRR